MGREASWDGLGITNHQAYPYGRDSIFLNYGSEAIIPVDICMETLHMEEINLDRNTSQLQLAQDQSKKRCGRPRSDSSLPITNQDSSSREGEGPRVSDRWPCPEAHHLEYQREKRGKTHTNWEGPYIVVTKGDKGSYTLADQNGKILSKQWNSFHLKWYYV